MTLASIYVFCFGLIVGSLLNVLIHRLPRGESVIFPGSQCPECKEKILWFDNIPVWSYLRLNGKCRRCGTRIPLRYTAVELLTGFICLGLYFKYGLSIKLGIGVIFLSLLLAVMVTDIETGLIPDALTLPGMIIGLVLTGFFPEYLTGEAVWWQGIKASAIGLLGGGIILWVTAWLGELIFRKESMGGGDIKLMAMMGAFLGFQKVCLIFFLAPVLALPVALYAKFAKKAETIPFGPYLSIAGGIMYIYGDTAVKYFFSYGF